MALFGRLAAKPVSIAARVRRISRSANARPPPARARTRSRTMASQAPIKAALTAKPPPPITMDRFAVRDLDEEFRKSYVRITKPGGDVSEEIDGLETTADLLQPGQVVPKSYFDEIVERRKKRLAARPELDKTIELPEADEKVELIRTEVTEGLQVRKQLQYFNLTVLPTLQYTAPLLLGLLVATAGATDCATALHAVKTA